MDVCQALGGLSCSTRTTQLFFQAAFVPIKAICALFLQVIGSLLLCLEAKEWGRDLKVRGEKMELGCQSLCLGLWAYGGRFLVYSENRDQSCRGSCYWMIDQHLLHPEKPLEEIAQVFEGGAPPEAVQMHRQNMIPARLEERQVWSEVTTGRWPPVPELFPGIYTFLIGYSRDANHPGKAHRFVLFNEGKRFLFNPSVGLSEWEEGDWAPLLDRIASEIRSSEAGYFTIECYAHTPT